MLEQHVARVNGTRLHYVTAGRGPPIVFVHGFPDFWYLWNEQLARFSAGNTVIAPDLRGYNLSEKPAGVEQYRLPLVVEDLRGLIVHLGLPPAVLVGHDWGAVVVWELAARYPELFSSIVAISTPPLDIVRRSLRDPVQRRRAGYQLMVTSSEAERILQAGSFELFERTVFTDTAVPPGYFTAEDRAAYRRAWAQPGAIRGGVSYYLAAHLLDYFGDDERQAFLADWTHPAWTVGGERFFSGARPDEVWGRRTPPPSNDRFDDTIGSGVDLPALFLVGERESLLLPDDGSWFGAYAARGTLVRIPNAGHRVVHEQSALVTARIRAFLAQQGSAAG